MGVIGKQNVQFYWTCKYSQILNPTWKEFPWDSYFDVLSIQSISGRQKSILSISLGLSLQTQKASQKVVSAEHGATFFSLSRCSHGILRLVNTTPGSLMVRTFFLSFFVMHWITSKSRLFPIFFLQSSEYFPHAKNGHRCTVLWIFMKKSLVFMASTDGSEWFFIETWRVMKKFWLENISLAKSFECRGEKKDSWILPWWKCKIEAVPLCGFLLHYKHHNWFYEKAKVLVMTFSRSIDFFSDLILWRVKASCFLMHTSLSTE